MAKNSTDFPNKVTLLRKKGIRIDFLNVAFTLNSVGVVVMFVNNSDDTIRFNVDLKAYSSEYLYPGKTVKVVNPASRGGKNDLMTYDLPTITGIERDEIQGLELRFTQIDSQGNEIEASEMLNIGIDVFEKNFWFPEEMAEEEAYDSSVEMVDEPFVPSDEAPDSSDDDLWLDNIPPIDFDEEFELGHTSSSDDLATQKKSDDDTASEFADWSYDSEDQDEEEENKEDYNDYEPDFSTEATGVDNSDQSYQREKISIALNVNEEERRNRLQQSERILCQKYKNIREMSSDNRLQELLDAAFPDGLQKQFYIRNLTLDSNTEYRVCAIRPLRLPEDALSDYIPDNETILFKGHVHGKQFIVDSIYDIADSERLPFEAECTAIQYKDLSQIGRNFLFDVCENTESITQYTREQLEEWDQYLNWRTEITKRQIYGCKYFKCEYDPDNDQIIFSLICPDQESFHSFRKYLRRGIEVFNNNYSKNNWQFDPADYDPKKRFESKELGRFIGIVNEYYLSGSYLDSSSYQPDESEDPNDEDDLDEEDTNEIDMLDIRGAFSNPYIAEVAFAVKSDELDIDPENDLQDSLTAAAIGHRVASSYFPDGFLALSAVGDYVLIRRLRNAITQLKNEEYYSPNLTTWLFNARLARLPSSDSRPEITKWLNHDVASNQNQCETIAKMLQAPDLCLIQGPPGTGKTTVIAEAIYQFVRNGERVLIASQSNDAVDNALERLAETPEIRAIRMGSKRKKRRKNEEDITQKYAEKEALWYYYKSLAGQVNETWLDQWHGMDRLSDEYVEDLHQIDTARKDLDEFNKRRNSKNSENFNKLREITRKKSEIQTIADQNEAVVQLQLQYQKFQDYLSRESNDQFYLCADVIRAIRTDFNDLFSYAKNCGVYLSNYTIEGEEETNVYDNERIAKAIDSVFAIKDLLSRFSQLNQKSDGAGDSEKIRSLQREIDQLSDKMDQEPDEEAAFELLREIRRLRREKEKLQEGDKTIELSRAERLIFDRSIQEKLLSPNPQSIIDQLSRIIDRWNSCMGSIQQIILEYIDRHEPKDLNRLEEERKILEGQQAVIQEDLNRINEAIALANSVLSSLRIKYGAPDDKPESTIKIIVSLQKQNSEKLEEHKQIRGDWEDTLKGFVDRLSDREAYPNEYEQFNDIFVRSCNVIGISCTGDMRSLQESGQNDFDVVIIDEVSKATPPELLIPLMRARKTILVGDHRQLPPMFKEHEASYKEMMYQHEDDPDEDNELFTMANFKKFERMVTASLFKNFFENADDSIKHSLLTQYRMHTDIMTVINRFYNNRLQQGLSAKQMEDGKNHGLVIKGIDGSSFIVPQKHAYWIDSSFLPDGTLIEDLRKEGSTSAYNCLEIRLILELLKKMAEEYKLKGFNAEHPKDIGVISFYQSQINELRNRFKEEKKHYDFSALSVDINTVDRFQGKEKSIIITSLVRNNKRGHASKHVVAFERINVAFSRAQQLLLIIGAKNLYEKLDVELPNMDKPGFTRIKVYGQILQELSIKGCFKTSEKLIDPEAAEQVKQEYVEAGGRL